MIRKMINCSFSLSHNKKIVTIIINLQSRTIISHWKALLDQSFHVILILSAFNSTCCELLQQSGPNVSIKQDVSSVGFFYLFLQRI